ncbi:MAG: hypothetical protein SynsKO_39860 [Synoicihabitans sp.]
MRSKSLILRLIGLTIWGANCVSAQGDLDSYERGEVEFGDGRVPFIASGEEQGALVLMVHGTPGGRENFTGFLNETRLTDRARIVAMVRPGWGGSQTLADTTRLQVQAAKVAAVLRAFPDRRPAIVVGHSLGGTIVAQSVMDHPELIDGALIVSASLDPAKEKTTWYQAIGRWKIVRWAVPDDLVAADHEIKALPDQLRAMSRRWSNVRTPIIVMQGDRDKLVPIAHLDYPARVAPQAVVATIRLEKQGHFVPWEQPEAMTAAILRLLDLATEGNPD